MEPRSLPGREKAGAAHAAHPSDGSRGLTPGVTGAKLRCEQCPNIVTHLPRLADRPDEVSALAGDKRTSPHNKAAGQVPLEGIASGFGASITNDSSLAPGDGNQFGRSYEEGSVLDR